MSRAIRGNIHVSLVGEAEIHYKEVDTSLTSMGLAVHIKSMGAPFFLKSVDLLQNIYFIGIKNSVVSLQGPDFSTQFQVKADEKVELSDVIVAHFEQYKVADPCSKGNHMLIRVAKVGTNNYYEDCINCNYSIKST